MKKFILILITVLLIPSCNKDNSVKQNNTKIQKEKKENPKIAEYYLKGMKAYKAKDWDLAIDNFDKAIKLKPEHRKAIKQKKLAIAEDKNKSILKASERLLLDDDYLGAMLKLVQIKYDSVYYKKAIELKKIAQDKYKSYRLKLAKKANDEGNYQKALSYLFPLLKAYPDFKKAEKLRMKILKEHKEDF